MSSITMNDPETDTVAIFARDKYGPSPCAGPTPTWQAHRYKQSWKKDTRTVSRKNFPALQADRVFN